MVEFLCGLVVLVPIVLLAIDLVSIYSGYSLNNRMCADAARAAASGPPDALMSRSPRSRAEGVIHNVYDEATVKKYNVLGRVVIHPDCVVTERLTSPIPSAALGGPIDGDVTVQTTVDVIPPFLIKQFMPGGVTLSTQQTFPYTYIVPSKSSN